MTDPRISVVMPVHNGEKHVADAVKSILCQSFTDFELIAVNDGSTDQTAEILGSILDDRLVIVTNEQNLGLVGSLNRAVERVSAPLVARMDADDIAYPNRLERQYHKMTVNPEIGVLGAWATDLDSGRLLTRPVSDVGIKTALLSNASLIHPTVMIRTELLRSVKYTDRYPHAEDFQLWVELSSRTQFCCLPEPLLMYRAHSGQVSSRFGEAQRTSRLAVVRNYLTKTVGEELVSRWFSVHLELIGVYPITNPSRVREWVRILQGVDLFSSNESRVLIQGMWSSVNRLRSSSRFSFVRRVLGRLGRRLFPRKEAS